jgi:hypothetical protein
MRALTRPFCHTATLYITRDEIENEGCAREGDERGDAACAVELFVRPCEHVCERLPCVEHGRYAIVRESVWRDFVEYVVCCEEAKYSRWK